MSIEVSGINSGVDTEIGILLYIKNHVSVEHEIGMIESGGNTNVTINKYFQNSPDFKKLENRIEEQTKRVSLLSESETGSSLHTEESYKLEQFKKAVNLFKASTLRLAETFLKINIYSERLKKARDLFDLGYIAEADKILNENDLIQDQDALLAKMEYLKHRKINILDILSSVAD